MQMLVSKAKRVLVDDELKSIDVLYVVQEFLTLIPTYENTLVLV